MSQLASLSKIAMGFVPQAKENAAFQHFTPDHFPGVTLLMSIGMGCSFPHCLEFIHGFLLSPFVSIPGAMPRAIP